MGPDLVQLAGVAEALGVAKRTAAKYVDLAGFPAPVHDLPTGRVWRRVEVERWGRANLPLPQGRPPKPHT
jgi:hypothetical protein